MYFFRDYSSSGPNGHIGSKPYQYIYRTKYGSYAFNGIDLNPDPGPKRPFNFFGHVDPVSMWWPWNQGKYVFPQPLLFQNGVCKCTVKTHFTYTLFNITDLIKMAALGWLDTVLLISCLLVIFETSDSQTPNRVYTLAHLANFKH